MKSGNAGMTTIMNAILFDLITNFKIKINISHKNPSGM